MIDKTFIEKLGAYEEGSMSPKEIIQFFQELVDKDVIWKLQGHYERAASVMLEMGVIKPRKEIPTDIAVETGEIDLFCNKVKKDLTSDNK